MNEPKSRTAKTPIRDALGINARGEIRRQRTFKGSRSTNPFHIPPEMIPDGVDLQFNVDTVVGMPTQERRFMEQQGWEPVTPDMWGGRFDGFFMRKGHKGEINVGGQVLMWRPLELTLEARAEELMDARRARAVEEQKMTEGRPDGVNLDMLDPNAGSARRQTFLRKERVPSMPVTD
jgi:hypothetical protein